VSNTDATKGFAWPRVVVSLLFVGSIMLTGVWMSGRTSAGQLDKLSQQVTVLEKKTQTDRLAQEDKDEIQEIKDTLELVSSQNNEDTKSQIEDLTNRLNDLETKAQSVASDGANGADGKDGKDGTDGIDGDDGADGSDASLPQSLGSASSPTFHDLELTGTLSVLELLTLSAGVDVTGNITSSGEISFGTKITGTCEGLTNFVWVPGSAKYGTLPGFCVAQYEARNNGSDVPVSTSTGVPWGNITQRDARFKSRDACDGCHLISEAEWMTIAENVVFVDANWSGGSVGSGCVFRGNVGSDDACGYDGDDPETGTGRDGKASLTLSTGEEIWDLAGNVLDMTDQYMIGEEGPADATPSNEDVEYTSIAKFGDFNYMQPPDDSWNSSDGIGLVYSVASPTTRRVIARGGMWGQGYMGGIYGVYLLPQTNWDTDANMGFRVAK
jgi:hypothetical protein